MKTWFLCALLIAGTAALAHAKDDDRVEYSTASEPGADPAKTPAQSADAADAKAPNQSAGESGVAAGEADRPAARPRRHGVKRGVKVLAFLLARQARRTEYTGKLWPCVVDQGLTCGDMNKIEDKELRAAGFATTDTALVFQGRRARPSPDAQKETSGAGSEAADSPKPAAAADPNTAPSAAGADGPASAGGPTAGVGKAETSDAPDSVGVGERLSARDLHQAARLADWVRRHHARPAGGANGTTGPRDD